MLKKLIPLLLFIFLFSFSGGGAFAQTPWEFKNNSGTNYLDFYLQGGLNPAFQIKPNGDALFRRILDYDGNSFLLDPAGTSTFNQVNSLGFNNANNITNGGQLTNTGNVGIGTTTPLVKLQVQKPLAGIYDSTTVAALFGDATAGQPESTYIIGNTINNSYAQAVNDISLWMNYRGYNGETTYDRNFIVGDGKGNIKLKVVGNTGNVGIGTGATNAAYALDVKSTGSATAMRLQNFDTASNNVQLRFYGANAAANQWAIGNEVATGGTGRNFDIYDLVAASNRLRVDSSGNIGIGTNAPDNKLTVQGTTHLIGTTTINGNLFIASGNSISCPSCSPAITSDERLKTDLKKLVNPIENLQLLNGYSYKFNTQEYPERKMTDKTQIGIVAQELEKVYPELVETDVDGFKKVNYSQFTAVLLEAIKQQQAQIDQLRKEVELLKNP